MNKAVRFIKDCGVFYLATVEGEFARVRPFGAITEFEGKVYICTSSDKNVSSQMIINPNVEISATAKSGDWIRLTGKVTVDNREEAKNAVKNEYPEINDMYKGRENLFQVLYFVDAIAIIYSNDGPERIKI